MKILNRLKKEKPIEPEPEIVNKTIGTVAAGVPDRPPSNEDYIYNVVEEQIFAREQRDWKYYLECGVQRIKQAHHLFFSF